jgi:hypothetical protein
VVVFLFARPSPFAQNGKFVQKQMDHFVLGGVLDVLNKVKAWLVFFVEIYVGGIVVVAGVQVAVGVLISFQSEVLAGDFHIAYFYGRGFVRKHGSGGGATH